jgi:transcriptional regulator with XRE-family HTH domain
MNTLTMSEQIRSLRKSKGLSQEALAEAAGINLRTLQRIETGNVIPRGETLRLLARALDVPILALSELQQAPGTAKIENPGLLKIMNLSALSFWFIPFGNILVPLALWIYKKNAVKGVNELGKRILNFQIIWSIVTYGIASVIISSGFSESYWINPMAMLPVMLFFYLANTIFIIATTRRISRGEDAYMQRA